MTLLQAARKFRKTHHYNPSNPMEQAREFLQQTARDGNSPNYYTTEDWLKVLSDFGVVEDADIIAFLENVAAYL